MKIRMAEDYVYDSNEDMMDRYGLTTDDLYPHDPSGDEDSTNENEEEDDE